jgi:hypothetical protein
MKIISIALLLMLVGCADQVSNYDGFKNHNVHGDIMVLQETNSAYVTDIDIARIEADGWKLEKVVPTSRGRNAQYLFRRVKK